MSFELWAMTETSSMCDPKLVAVSFPLFVISHRVTMQTHTSKLTCVKDKIVNLNSEAISPLIKVKLYVSEAVT